MKPLFLVVECPVDDTLDKAIAHSLVSHEMQKKADSHSLDPRKITLSHLYASQEGDRILILEHLLCHFILFTLLSQFFLEKNEISEQVQLKSHFFITIM